MPNLDADFFYEHAGWSYDPLVETPEEGRRRNSETLARAWALVSLEAEFQWHADGLEHRGDSNSPDTCEGCLMIMEDDELSLWCIDDADENYRRVIEAELALEYYKTKMGKVQS